MNDISMTIVGNVVNEVELRFTNAGEAVAKFRVAASSRRYDRANEKWVDGDTHYFSVSCWRNLAHNSVSSIKKGMPVIVVGRLRSRQVEKECGDHKHTMYFHDIEASSVGPDLARGTATFERVKRNSVTESEERNLADDMELERMIREDAESLDEEGLEVDLETGEVLEPVA